MALKFYKLKVVKLRGLITTFVEVTGEKLVRGGGGGFGGKGGGGGGGVLLPPS